MTYFLAAALYSFVCRISTGRGGGGGRDPSSLISWGLRTLGFRREGPWVWVDVDVVDCCLVDMVVVIVVLIAGNDGGGGNDGSETSGTVGGAALVEMDFWLVGRASRIFEVLGLGAGEKELGSGCAVVAVVVVLLSSGAESKQLVDKSPARARSGFSEAANSTDDSSSEETGFLRD